MAQNGIQAFGAASVTIGGTGAGQANTVSDDSYAGGGAGNSASGILLLNNGPTSVTDNNVSDSATSTSMRARYRPSASYTRPQGRGR